MSKDKMIEWLEWLDGRGLVITDWELIKEELKALPKEC